MRELIRPAVAVLFCLGAAIINWNYGNMWRSGFCTGMAVILTAERGFAWWEKRKKPAEPA